MERWQMFNSLVSHRTESFRKRRGQRSPAVIKSHSQSSANITGDYFCAPLTLTTTYYCKANIANLYRNLINVIFSCQPCLRPWSRAHMTWTRIWGCDQCHISNKVIFMLQQTRACWHVFKFLFHQMKNAHIQMFLFYLHAAVTIIGMQS